MGNHVELLADALLEYLGGSMRIGDIEQPCGTVVPGVDRRLRVLLANPQALTLSHGVLAIDRTRVWIDQGQTETALCMPRGQVAGVFAGS